MNFFYYLWAAAVLFSINAVVGIYSLVKFKSPKIVWVGSILSLLTTALLFQFLFQFSDGVRNVVVAIIEQLQLLATMAGPHS